MDDTWIHIILGLFGGGGLATLVNTLISKHKTKQEKKAIEADIKDMEAETEKKEAETINIITQAATAAASLVGSQLEKMRAENETMKCQITALQDENTKLRNVQQDHEKKIIELQAIAEQFDQVLDGAHTLYGQVVELNGQPKYKPPEKRKRDKTV